MNVNNVTVGRSFSDDSAMCWVLPVSWMTWFSHNGADGPESKMARIYASSSSPGGGTGAKLLSTIVGLLWNFT